MSQYDTILHPDFVVPIVPRGQVLEAHSVALAGQTIAAIMPRSEATKAATAQHIDLKGCALMPGLINLHCHAAMSLLRGYADDMPLMSWLQQYIWPTEQRMISPEFVRDGSDLAIAELLKGGTTTLVDNYFFPEITAEQCDSAGLRALLNFPIIDMETAWARDAEACINRGLELRDRYRDHDRIEIGFGPHSTYGVSETILGKVAMLAEELDAPVHIHLQETKEEVLNSVERCGLRPIDLLQRLGLLGPRTHCVHMNAVGEQDIENLAIHGAHVVHCPRSNLKLGSGISPVQKLLDRGVNVALGTDGAASNNRLNMLAEAQTAALIGKVRHGDPRAVDAWTVLEMATLSGARALGQAHRLGSIETGKLADLIAVDISGMHQLPLNNLASNLVYASSGKEVLWSWVGGRLVMQDGQLQTLDYSDVTHRVLHWSNQLAAFRSSLEA
jgi:5-methylthioadenosine/S-adenosylhomocysteine deaminase